MRGRSQTLQKISSAKRRSYHRRGVGFIDALYDGLLAHYAREFASLKTLKFKSFDATGDMATSTKTGAMQRVL